MVTQRYTKRFEEILDSGMRIRIPIGDLYSFGTAPLVRMLGEGTLVSGEDGKSITGSEDEKYQPRVITTKHIYEKTPSGDRPVCTIRASSPHDYKDPLWGKWDVFPLGLDIIGQNTVEKSTIELPNTNDELKRISESTSKELIEKAEDYAKRAAGLVPIFVTDYKPTLHILASKRDVFDAITHKNNKRDPSEIYNTIGFEKKYGKLHQACLSSVGIHPKETLPVERSVEWDLFGGEDEAVDSIICVVQTGTTLGKYIHRIVPIIPLFLSIPGWFATPEAEKKYEQQLKDLREMLEYGFDILREEDKSRIKGKPSLFAHYYQRFLPEAYEAQEKLENAKQKFENMKRNSRPLWRKALSAATAGLI